MSVNWEVNHPSTEMDFISVFECPEGHPEGHIDIDNLLDTRVRGLTHSCQGEIAWVMDPTLFYDSECVVCEGMECVRMRGS